LADSVQPVQHFSRRILRHGLLLFVLAFGVTVPASASAGPKVQWDKITVRPGDDGRRVAKILKLELKRASRREDWTKGSGKSAKKRKSATYRLSAKVTTLDWVKDDDVLRVSVTVVARIDDGPRGKRQHVRSHIRMGGHPKRRRKLEEQALQIVARGIVTRLAEVARR